MPGAFVEGSELRRSQVLVGLVADMVCLKMQSAYRLESKSMLLLGGVSTNNMQCDRSQKRIEHGRWGWNWLRFGEQVAIEGLAVGRCS
jgi:hypothetical protein